LGIPVFGICKWDYKKFVKCLLFPVKGLVPNIVLCVPNGDVQKEVARIITEVARVITEAKGNNKQLFNNE